MNTNGLSNKQVIDSRRKYGSNIITTKMQKSFFKQFIETLGDPIIKILIIVLAVKTVFLFRDFNWFETLGILIAVFLASFISTISEYGSEKAFLIMQEESSKLKCRVKRNNKIEIIPIEEIVVGDIVLLSSGDKIPADGVIVSGEIEVDESSLNGEAKEVYKTVNSKVYRGCVVYSKNALMQVSAVGNKTLYGQMVKEIDEDTIESPLKLRLRNLAKVISRIGYIGAFLVMFSYLFSNIVIANSFNIDRIINTLSNHHLIINYLIHAVTLGVTIIVVAVPEGLPMMITLVLSSNMRRMLKDHVLVRKLVGIETAGSLNVLLTDKTGTITKGNLEVVGFTSGSLKNYNNELELSTYERLYKYLKLSLVFNTEAILVDKNIVGGNKTEQALRSFIKTPSPNIEIISKEPFNSVNKCSSCVIKYRNEEIELIKGAPEILIDKCSKYIDEDGVKLKLDQIKAKKYIDSVTSLGNRVILLMYKDKYEYVLIGYMLLKDEVRKEAIEGLKLVKDAGINTIMITGDNKNTAISVGREIGLITSNTDIVLTAEELNKIDDEQLKNMLPNLKIIARSMPLDKSRLVRVFQEDKKVVGMTGDGVNDAPALRKADVGFSMGSGTEVSKEASKIVILDDNFLSISKAILYGRTTFKSIRKFIIFQLTINMCAILLSIVGPFIGINTPVTVVQMLWINMIMDTLAGIAFSYEPALIEYMKEKPKKRDENILNRYMLGEILFTGLYSSLLCIFFLKSSFIKNIYRSSNTNNYLMTAFFALFIFISIFNSFNARTHRLNLLSRIKNNLVFAFIVLLIVIIQIILIYYGGSLFRSYGLTLKELLITILISSSVIPVDWIRKLYLRYRGCKEGV